MKKIKSSPPTEPKDSNDANTYLGEILNELKMSNSLLQAIIERIPKPMSSEDLI